MIRQLVLLALLFSSLIGCGERSPQSASAPASGAGHRVSVEGLPWAQLSPKQVEEAAFLGIPAAFENPVGMRFVYIPAGTFEMGSPETEPGRSPGETLHKVTLTMGYYLQVSPATNEQLRRAGAGPATGVTHAEAVSLAAATSALDPTWDYRLPSEAEWEHACRAGSQAPHTPAEGADTNAWGLKGMQVGIREWVRDRHAPLPSWPMGDPLGPREPEGEGMVVRGGGTAVKPARSAQRAGLPATTRADDLGFRLLAPIGYGLGAYGSVEITFRLTDPLAGEGEAPPETLYDLRIIKMNDRLSARMAGVETDWRRLRKVELPLTLSMVPGKYYVHAETIRKGGLVRGREIKFHAWGEKVDVPVPIPERNLKRYGSGIDEKPQ